MNKSDREYLRDEMRAARDTIYEMNEMFIKFKKHVSYVSTRLLNLENELDELSRDDE